MIGLAFANPAIVMAFIHNPTYRPHQVIDGSPAELAKIKQFLSVQDKRKKFMCIGGPNGGCDVLRFIKANAITAGIDLSNVIVAVADAAERLQTLKGVKIVDAEAGPDGRLRHVRWDRIEECLADAAPGLDEPVKAAVVAAVEPVDNKLPEIKLPRPPSKPVEPLAKPKSLTAKAAKPAPVEPAPVPVIKVLARKGSLADLFDPLLAEATTDERRERAGQWVAAQIEGLLDKASWKKACEKMTIYGMRPEAVKAAMKTLKKNSLMLKLRDAGVFPDLSAGAVKFDVDLDDLKWLDAHWPLQNMTLPGDKA